MAKTVVIDPATGRERTIDQDEEGIGYDFQDPNRIHEMNWGCRNCLHFDNDPVGPAGKKWGDMRQEIFNDRMAREQARGLVGKALMFAAGRAIAQFDEKAKHPQAAIAPPPRGGLCRKGEVDWTHLASSCDKFAAREAVGEKLTMLPEEARAKLGDDDVGK